VAPEGAEGEERSMKTSTGTEKNGARPDHAGRGPAAAPDHATGTGTTTGTSAAPGAPASPLASTLGAYVERVRGLTGQHPAGAVVATAGAGLLYAAELTVVALEGIGGERLFRKQTAPQLRAELRRQREDLLVQTRPQRERLLQTGQRLLQHGQALKQRGEKLVERGKTQGEQLLHRGRALWPFRRPTPPKATAQA
jgi:hypothetical protein